MQWPPVFSFFFHTTMCVVGRLHTTRVALAEFNDRGNNTSAEEGGYGPRPMLSAFGGFYIDPNHYKGESYAGTRMIADHPAHGTAEEITMVGTNDGRTFWTASGRFTDVSKGHLVIDFGTNSFSGTYSSEYGKPKIRWPDGNQWDRKMAPPLPANTPSGLSAGVAGFYTDPNHYREGTFAGTRFVSCPRAGAVTLVGTDDGHHFWAVPGTYSGNRIGVDFSSKGGPSALTGTYSDGKISWKGGNTWSRPGGSLPPAPKSSHSHRLTASLFCTIVVLAMPF